jgi:hypothetical protein
LFDSSGFDRLTLKAPQGTTAFDQRFHLGGFGQMPGKGQAIFWFKPENTEGASRTNGQTVLTLDTFIRFVFTDIGHALLHDQNH